MPCGAEIKDLQHTVRMPFDLQKFFARFLTDLGDLVLGPFGGSNTKGSAADLFRRRSVTIKKDSDYVEGGQGRFAKS